MGRAKGGTNIIRCKEENLTLVLSNSAGKTANSSERETGQTDPIFVES